VPDRSVAEVIVRPSAAEWGECGRAIALEMRWWVRVGVYYVPTTSKLKLWWAVIGADRRVIQPGMFATKEDAAAATRAALDRRRPRRRCDPRGAILER
jgi:hypothetical protein